MTITAGEPIQNSSTTVRGRGRIQTEGKEVGFVYELTVVAIFLESFLEEV
jgi:hypothetical protein